MRCRGRSTVNPRAHTANAVILVHWLEKTAEVGVPLDEIGQMGRHRLDTTSFIFQDAELPTKTVRTDVSVREYFKSGVKQRHTQVEKRKGK
jgi:hypothetical protein